jgi:ATP-binding cassette, subfamily B, bacterial
MRAETTGDSGRGWLAGLARRYGFVDARSWPLFARYFRPYRLGLLAYAVGAALVSLLLLPVVLLVRHAFETTLPAGDVGGLAAAGALIVGIRLCGTAASLALRMKVVRIIKSAVMRMREDLLELVYASSREKLTKADVDRLQTRIVQDTERVDALGNAILSGVLPALFSSLALAAGLLYFSWSLVLACIVLVPMVWLASAITSRFVARDVRRFQGAFESFNKGVSFVLRQMDLTRVQGCEAQEIERQKKMLGELRTSGEQMSWSFAVHGQVQATVTGVLGIALLVLGGMQVAQGTMTLGAFIAFYFGAGLLNGYVSTVFAGTAAAAAGAVSLTTLADLFDAHAPPAYRGTEPLEFAGRLTLREVSFDYGREPVLRRASLDVRSGQRVALVGANGAGKTTLLNLLLGLSAPSTGEVLADGQPYATLDLAGLRRQIGVVMQRAGMFHGSVRQNIAYGCEEATQAQIEAAAKIAGIHEFIESLAQGYDSQIGDAGVTISGGEAQRLAIARAVLRAPRALILDEPTNHLDVRAVRELLDALAALPTRPTVILVSHDPRLVDFADVVYRLENGRVAAMPSATDDRSTPGSLPVAASVR